MKYVRCNHAVQTADLKIVIAGSAAFDLGHLVASLSQNGFASDAEVRQAADGSS